MLVYLVHLYQLRYPFAIAWLVFSPITMQMLSTSDDLLVSSLRTPPPLLIRYVSLAPN